MQQLAQGTSVILRFGVSTKKCANSCEGNTTMGCYIMVLKAIALLTILRLTTGLATGLCSLWLSFRGLRGSRLSSVIVIVLTEAVVAKMRRTGMSRTRISHECAPRHADIQYRRLGCLGPSRPLAKGLCTIFTSPKGQDSSTGASGAVTGETSVFIDGGQCSLGGQA